MTILYNYTTGDIARPLWGIIFLVLAGALFLLLLATLKGREPFLATLVAVGMVLAIALGVGCFQDTRMNFVVATIDQTASWKEISEQYELMKIEGELYTFRVMEKEEN